MFNTVLRIFSLPLLTLAQLVFTSFYLGIAKGALKRGLAYTKANTRGWPYQPSEVARGTDEF